MRLEASRTNFLNQRFLTAHWELSTCNQLLVPRRHAVSSQLGSNWACKHAEGGLGCGQMPIGLGTDERHKWPVVIIPVGPCGLGCQ